MKITGTKKLLIILFALACALTAALGVIFTRPAIEGTVAYAASEGHSLPLAEGEKDSDAYSLADKEALEALVKETGLDAKILSFYARSNGGTESELYEAFKEDPMLMYSDIMEFLDAYECNAIESKYDISEEDWYLSPDEVNTYGSAKWYGDGMGLQNTWLNYYSSKAGGITTESQYYRNSNFAMGYYVKWDNTIYSNYNYKFRRRKHSYMLYNIVWLDEGESYTFGFYLAKPMMTNGVFAEATSSSNFLSTDTYVTKYLFSNNKVTIDPDNSRNTRDAYYDEFGSTITPAASSYSTAFGTAGAVGDKRMTIKPDAPSGAYMIVCQSNSDTVESGSRFCTWNTTGNPTWGIRMEASTVNDEGWANYSVWCTYATLVCRKGITKPKLEFGDGVSPDLTSKTVAFNNTAHEIVIEGDWGPGLENYVISEWDDVNSTWKAFAANTSSTNVTQSSRGTRGSISKAGLLKFKATNAGKYKISLSSFRNWGDDESDRAPVEFEFTITPREMEIPELIQEEGVNKSTNTKYVNETGNDKFVSIYPAPSNWTTYSQSGPYQLSQFTWSSNGVLTLSQKEQGVYIISINLRFNTGTAVNQLWADGTTGPKVFTFEIGPMKISVPDIIKDAGDITTFKKEVTFNGADQTLSFMPVDPSQLNFNLIDGRTGLPIENYMSMLSIKDSTLTFTAFDAGEYHLIVSVKDRYIFDDANKSLTLTYILKIKEMAITVPKFEMEGLTKTVTYGGEKDSKTGEDWVATMTFTNCDESRIEWVSTTLSQQLWSDSTLILAGRSAKEYEVSFRTKKNYRWEDGEPDNTYKLVIEKLKIEKPELIKDGEVGATFQVEDGIMTKWVMYSPDVVHPFILEFASTKEIIEQGINYTKSSSIEFSYNGNFAKDWKGDRVTFSTEDAGVYSFEIYPTQNYCWTDGTTTSVRFGFTIQPIEIPALHLYTTDTYGTELVYHEWNMGFEDWSKNNGFWALMTYNGTPKDVRIGIPGAFNSMGKYVTDEDDIFAKSFYLMDDAGNILSVGNASIGDMNSGVIGVTCSEEGGFLSFKINAAGIYRIQVFLKSTDYRWEETHEASVEYAIKVNPEAVAIPEINREECEEGLGGHYDKVSLDTTYYKKNIVLAIDLTSAGKSSGKGTSTIDYKDIVRVEYYTYITNPADNPNREPVLMKFKYDDKYDTEIFDAANDALKYQNGTYVGWDGNIDVMYFFAKDYGTYTFRIILDNPNYAWASGEKYLEFTITVNRAPVNGLEMHYYGDESEHEAGTDVIVGNITNIMGNHKNATNLVYGDGTLGETPIQFNQKAREIWFTRSTVDNLDFVDFGFDVEYTYDYEMSVMDNRYDGQLTDPTQSIDKNGLLLGFTDAGTYTIIIRLTYNYRWAETLSSGDSLNELRFTFVITKRVIDKPLIITDDGSTTKNGFKEAEYENDYLTLQLKLASFPDGYAIAKVDDGSGNLIDYFTYVSPDKSERTDIVDVRTTGTGKLNGKTINLGVDNDPAVSTLSVQAQSAGEYLLVVGVSNINNYQLTLDNYESFSYRFIIKRRSVSLPNAYLDLTPISDASNLDRVDVVKGAASGDAYTAGSENTKTVGYDTLYHAVYLYGASVEEGNFFITVTLSNKNAKGEYNGDSTKKIIQPTDILTDNKAAKYFRLAALDVNTYTITLEFVTRDFYWDNDISSSNATRSYRFVITRKLVEVPKIDGGSNLTLKDDKYTIDFEYDHTLPRDITLLNVEFGGDLGSGKYSVINFAIDGSSTAGAVKVTPSYTNGLKDTIKMETVGVAQVKYTYIIRLEIDGNNMRWNTNGEGDTAPKFYEINIYKQKITRPYIIDTVTTTGDTKTETYTGSDWIKALKIALMDSTFVSYSLETPLMTVDSLATQADPVTGKIYDNLLIISTNANVANYIVKVSLADTNNTEWFGIEDPDKAILPFPLTLEIAPMKIAKPSIFIDRVKGETEASMGVVGLTRTVVYEDNPLKEHMLDIAGYWANTADGTAPSSSTNVPNVMNYKVTNGESDLSTPTFYTAGKFSGDGYNEFNDGLLSFGATLAMPDGYKITFKLTPNAIWLDDSVEEVVIQLVVNKKQHDDLYIYNDPTDGKDGISGDGRTITFTYALDSLGDAVERFLRIDNFDTKLMTYNGVISGTKSTNNDDGYLRDGEIDTDLGIINSGASYIVKASNAGEYEIEFKLIDFRNHRWAFADQQTCSFKLVINKLVLSQPVVNFDHNLTNEKSDGKTVTVDYDKRLHTILVESLFDKMNNGVYSNIGDHYFTVKDDTSAKNRAKDPSYNALTHPTYFESYDDTSSTKVKDLFEDTSIFDSSILDPAYSYTGATANDYANLLNLFRLTAYTPGDYYMVFTLTDSANMEWADSAGRELEYKLVINKVKHDKPTVANGTYTSLEYTGDKVEFTLKNTYNGITTPGGPVDGTVSEEYEVIAYSGPRTDVAANLATTNFEVSWFNGNLTLGFTEIGSYTVEVRITDTNYIAWNGTSDVKETFVFTVAKRQIGASVTYSAASDPELDARLQEGKNIWPISVEGSGVDAQIILSGLRDVPTATKWDQTLAFKVYYENVADGIAKKTEAFANTDIPIKWSAVKQNDGTYNLIFWYTGIDNGKGNIIKGKYNLCIEQTDTDGNHIIPSVIKLPFEVDADPAPFKKDMLEWVYTRSDDMAVIYYPITTLGLGGAPDNRFVLPYEEGVSYTFHARLNAEGQNGFDGSKPSTFVGQLNSWFVNWDGSYVGLRTVSNATQNSVYITITALVPNEYSFANYDFTLFYTIGKAKYDLSNLQWNYDGNSPFTYDTMAKSVAVVAKSGTSWPTGLMFNGNGYSTSGTYTSGTLKTVTYSGNAVAYAGNYITTVSFKVAANSNYVLPEMSKPDSYIGSFEWTRTWEIKPQHIIVDWVQGKTVSSDGSTITASKPAVAGEHASKFAFTYEVKDGSGWKTVNSITRTPGTVVTYRATAYLRSGSNHADYARNYTFEFLGKDNPLEFEVGGDDTVIYNHITVGGVMETNYEYRGTAYYAETEIDMDTSNGQITLNNITIQYYKRDPATNQKIGSPIAAPVEVGNYIVVLKLKYTNTTENFALLEDTYIYNIVKAKLRTSEFEWHVKHTYGVNTIEARYDTSLGGKWVNIATGEEVLIAYDGAPYNIILTTTYASTIIRFSMVNASQINANSYTATASIAFIDSAHYEFDPADPLVLTFGWVIEKQYLDLKEIIWNYEEPFVFTVVNGKPKAFAAEIINLPDYLLDKVTYTVYKGTELLTSEITNQGDYRTKVAINESLIDNSNYELGSWPVSVPKTIDWKINRREIVVPESDNSWSEFDGIQHNLLRAFNFDVDWQEYFDVDVTYTALDGGNEQPYDGSKLYGGKYYAYNAGTYKFTLKIHSQFNTGSVVDSNIVWVVTSNNQTTRTPNDRTVSYTVEKKEIVVTGWLENNESSHVILSGNLDSSKFIEYNFYWGDTGTTGTPAELNDILNSAGGDKFSMVPVVRSAFSGNITLIFEPGTEFITFVTPEITEENATQVTADRPYIYGYSTNGTTYNFTNEQLASKDIYVIYTGEPITFKIRDWDTYYCNYLTVYDGDDLTQTEAGPYKIRLILRNDLEKPLYWGKTADNKLDRSEVVLEFEIRFRLLTTPNLPTEVEYDGSEIDIMTKLKNMPLSQLMAEYGDYVTISGNKATNVGEYSLYLEIKEEYSYAVRWKAEGYENGRIGSYSLVWYITPIILTKPEQNFDIVIEYDGTAHSVYEVIKGYDGTNSTPEILKLMEYITVLNGHGINAKTYNAEFVLPSTNFAWSDGKGKASEDRSSVKIDWTINKSIINFEKAYWGYMDGDEAVAYNPEKPFVFTVENGQIKNHTVEIFGLPDILKFYTVYRMSGQEGVNYAGAVGKYTTTVQFNLQMLDRDNFVIGEIPTSISQLSWEIVAREFNQPEFDGSWTVFDAKIHDLTKLLKLPEDWAEYLEISVEYTETQSDLFKPYKGEDDFAVDYSNYNGFYVGLYRLTVTLKNDGTILVANTNIKWVGGTAPEPVIIEVKELDLTVVGWFEENEYSHVLFEDDLELSGELADRFEHIIYADGDLNKTPLKPEDVIGGQTYYMLFGFKSGTDAKGVKYSYGIKLTFAEGVSNPYEFGNYSYGDQPIIWLPAPLLEKAVFEYNGEAQTAVIKDIDTLYKLSTTQRLRLNTLYQLGLDDSVKSYVYLQNANSLTATAAGTYSAVLRLLSKVRLSWYDSNVYSTDANGNLIYKSNGTIVEDAERLFNNKSYTLTYKITPKKVPLLTDEDLELFAELILRYTGEEQDVTEAYRELFDKLEEKYGKIFDYVGSKGTEAKVYELLITLADLDSCFWYDGKFKETKVPFDGYVFTYIQVESGWKLALVKTDEEGNIERDSAGNYIEYNDGEYRLEVEYQPEYVWDFVEIQQGDMSLLNEDGTVSEFGKYFYDADGDPVILNGQKVEYSYKMYSGGIKVARFEYNDDIKDFLPDENGTFVQRIRLDEKADAKYGYKVALTEDATEYTYLLDMLEPDENGILTAPKVNGVYIDTYLYEVSSNVYQLRRYTLNEDGTFNPDDPDAYTIVENKCDIEDTTTYSLVNGKYVAHPTGGGEYMVRFVLEAGSTNRKQQVVYAKDEHGNPIVDAYSANTVVYQITYESAKDVEYKIEWLIDHKTLSKPVFDEDNPPQYTGDVIYAKDILKGFIDDYMEIVSGGAETEVGTYYARIIITNPNSKWDPEATSEDFVIVEWRIAPVELDMRKIKWVYTDGTNIYEDDSEFVYTRVKGKPIVYWVELAGVPDALKSKISFSTNGKDGAYKGTDAGTYVTHVEFDIDDSFIGFELPETFNQTITWHIQRRVLEVPHFSSVYMIFDSQPHDLLEILGVSEDWDEYYDIKVQYASNFVDYKDYEGHDGNRYEAFGSGAYKFTLSIKSEVNTTENNPNVVWAKANSEPEPPEKGDPDSPETPEPETQSIYALGQSKGVGINSIAVKYSAQQSANNGNETLYVCDGLDEIESHSQSFAKSCRKYA